MTADHRSGSRPALFFWSFIAVITLLRLLAAAAGHFGLGVDEAHYALYGRFLDWSYFDHPPLVGWTQALFQLLPLPGQLQVRLAALLISLLTSKLLLDYLTGKGLSFRAAAWAVVALNLTPMYNAMSLALLPDCLLMPLTLLVIAATEKVLRQPDLRRWCLLGLWLGLAGLAKYTAVIFLPAITTLFVYRRQWGELLRLRLWAGVLVALVLVLPVLYWNIQHDFSSFRYQGDHVLSVDASLFRNLGLSFAIQLASWGIGPFLVALGAHIALLGKIRRDDTYTVPVVFLTFFLLFFIYIASAEVLLPHWMLIYFMLMVPLAYAVYLQQRRLVKTLAAATLVSSALTLPLLLELAFQVFPKSWTATAYEGIYDWDGLMAEAATQLEKVPNTQKGLAVMNWTLGSRAMYYNPSAAPVYVIDRRQDQFDIWTGTPPPGTDLIAVIEAGKKDEHLAHLNCAEIASVGEKTSILSGVTVNRFLLFHCVNFLGYK